MKQNYFLRIFSLLILLNSFIFLNAQTLSSGDIAIIGVGVDNEEILLVALKDIPANETVFFTDEEWGGTSFNSGEGFVQWTTTAINAGTTVTISFNSDSSTDGGTITNITGSLALGNSGDGMYIYQTADNLYNGTPTILGFAGEDSGDAGTLTGTGLTLGTNAVYFGGDNGIYTGARTGGNQASYLSLIYDSANWTTSGSSQTFDTTLFSLSSDQAINFDTSSSTENETDTNFNTSIPVTLSNYTADVTISVSVNASSTAESGDYTLNTTSLTFTGNGTQNISLDINDDADMDNETVILDIAVTSGTANITTDTHTVTIQDDDLPEVMFSEIMYNTPTSGGTDDEWIEITNNSGGTITLTNWTIEYSGGTFTFPSAVINNGQYITIALGSNGDGTFNNDAPFPPDFNDLGVTNDAVKDTDNTNNLTNSSGTITLKNDSGTTIDTVFYDDGHVSSTDGNGDSYELINVNNNNSSTSSNWQGSIKDGGSPKRASGATWTGTTSNDWANSNNWLNDTNPSFSSDVLIPNTVTNYPTASSFIITNSITFEEGASLITSSFVNGTITYNRSLTTNWHLIASPVINETVEDIISNHSLATGSGSNVGLGFYNNSGANAWTYQTSTSTGTINEGTGMIIKLDAAGTVKFSGDFNKDPITIGLTTGDRTSFNLIGNSFTAYVNSTAFLNSISNAPTFSEQTVWLWDGTQYITRNLANPIEIAPAQGFFVKAAINNNVFLNPSMLSHQGTDTFMREEPKTNIELFVESNNVKKSTDLFYINNTTTAFDNGYDSSVFDGVSENFNIYTQLLSNPNNEIKKLAIQSLPNNNYENMVVPVGITSEAGKEITFSITTTNLPNTIEVYLEDRLNNVFTNLSKENYKVVVNGSTTDQFYIHTTSQKLGVDSFENSLENIRIYQSSKNELTVTGLSSKVNNIHVYSIVGKSISSIKTNGNNTTISLPRASTGVYLVEITSEVGKTSKKIIFE
ncbi:lamin tail domain-containing protein [Tenacibaculum sp. 190524A02b]|uniref:lamin tail domain-containing protein n=1 Tax=Tenacibaculum vairaonense TaxID=3137860 RepID=UPI0031FAB426